MLVLLKSTFYLHFPILDKGLGPIIEETRNNMFQYFMLGFHNIHIEDPRISFM